MSTHHRPTRGTAFALAALLALGATAHAQQQIPSALPSPRLLLVTPPGARAGTSVEVTLTGTDLESPDRLVFSHPGIKAESVVAPEPPKPAAGKAPPPQLVNRRRRGMGTPTVSKFKVTVPADVPVGIQDVRLVNKWGVSNPRAFVVGDLAEVAEKEPNNDQPESQRVEINSTINGAMASPVDVDYFVFAGKKGQRVVLSCLASSIDSRFEPNLELYDGKNNLLASNHAYRGNDALTDCTLPSDGDYYVRLAEFTYTRGTAEHFYRLSITTAPWIDAVHPCVVEPGKSTQVTVYGRNLPGGKLSPRAVEGDRTLESVDVTVTAPGDLNRLAFRGYVPPGAAALAGFEFRVRNAAGASNPFLLTLARSPVVRDNDANDTPETAQAVTVPCEVAGRIEKRRDRDWYTFAAKKGDVLTIDVQSERLGAPTFMYFMLRDEKGRELFESQDVNMNEFSRKFWSRSDDPAPYRFAVPADGKYQLLVGSRTGDTLAGPRHYYRLRIAPERPDFELVVMAGDSTRPSGAAVPAGGNGSLTVVALREGGFADDVALTVEGLPPGVTCPPQSLGGGQREARIALHADATAKPWAGEIKVKGTATVRGQKVVREARPAGIVWPVQPQQNTPTISRLDRSLLLAVGGPAPWDLGLTLDKPVLTQGERGTIKLNLKRLWPDFKGALAVQAQNEELPRGLNINNNQPVNVAAGKNDGTLNVIVNGQVPPGLYTIVLRSQSQVPYNRDPAAKQKPNVNVTQYSAPVTLTVLPKELARLSLSNQSQAVKAGAQADLVVKVNRLHNYDGEFKIEVVLPPNTKGVEVAGAVIPAGKDEAKLVVKVPAGTAPGGRNNLVVRATAMTRGHAIKHEVKFNVNVVK